MTYIIFFTVIILDQLVKFFIERNIALGNSVLLIPKVLSLTNLHNTGAAWGSFSGYRVLLISVSVICTALLIYLHFKLIKTLPVRGKIILALIASGSIGNMIDRLFLGYVRDMFEVLFIDFPVFNVADCAITIGTVLLVIDTLFFDKTSIFGLLESRLKKGKQTDK